MNVLPGHSHVISFTILIETHELEPGFDIRTDRPYLTTLVTSIGELS